MKRHALPGSVVVFAIAVGLSGSPAAAGQTLGEVAKKEADRRKAQPPAVGGKVYTNKDLPASAQKPATANPAVTSTEAPAQTPTDPVAAATEQKAEGAKAPGDKPQGDHKDQAYWKSRMTTAREELRRSEMFAEALQTRVNTLNKDFNSRDNPAQRSAIGADRTEALNELTRVKQDVERGKKQIADIEEEARKAGVPPGWVR
jgi:predicted component of type VI protein secretion system